MLPATGRCGGCPSEAGPGCLPRADVRPSRRPRGPPRQLDGLPEAVLTGACSENILQGLVHGALACRDGLHGCRMAPHVGKGALDAAPVEPEEDGGRRRGGHRTEGRGPKGEVAHPESLHAQGRSLLASPWAEVDHVVDRLVRQPDLPPRSSLRPSSGRSVEEGPQLAHDVVERLDRVAASGQHDRALERADHEHGEGAGASARHGQGPQSMTDGTEPGIESVLDRGAQRRVGFRHVRGGRHQGTAPPVAAMDELRRATAAPLRQRGHRASPWSSTRGLRRPRTRRSPSSTAGLRSPVGPCLPGSSAAAIPEVPGRAGPRHASPCRTLPAHAVIGPRHRRCVPVAPGGTLPLARPPLSMTAGIEP